MVSLSYGRLLRTRPIITGLVALAALLALAATTAASSSVQAATGHRSRVTSAAHLPYPLQIAPADTDPIIDSVPVKQTSRKRAGYVVTVEQLLQEQDFPLSSVLIAHFPGIRVIHGNDVDRVANGLNLNMTGAPCFLQIFVDGIHIENGGVDWLSVRNIASIEYRTPGNIPVQYQNRLPGAMCGVLLFWSKFS